MEQGFRICVQKTSPELVMAVWCLNGTNEAEAQVFEQHQF